MVRASEGSAAPGPAPRSRYALLTVAAVLTAGTLGQFFLAGLSVFDTPRHWTSHATFGSVLGLVAYVAWIPAVLGRVGWKLVVGSVLLPVLFTAQHALVVADEPWVQALHPLNGAFLFAISLWMTVRTIGLVRGGRGTPADERRGQAKGGTPFEPSGNP